MSGPTPSLDAAERRDRLRLYRSENVGPMAFRQLLARFRTAGAALEALPSLAARGGRRRKLKVCPKAEAERELAELDAAGGWMVHRGEPDFPPLLAAVEDAPPLLSGFGHRHLLTREAVAVVGSRDCSLNGRRLSERFGRELGAAGYVVISGMAKGIDAAAQQGALETGTIAVLAGGVDVVYPKENQELYDAIAARGAVVSEMPLGTVGQARHFPRRNRIIAGLARGVLVVEAKQRSGSLITARLAGEQGREVFAMPGSPIDPRARGPNDLIRKGAALTESADEIVEALGALPDPGGAAAPQDDFADAGGAGATPDEDELARARAAIDSALSPTPVEIDALARELELPLPAVYTVLLEMELAGTVARLPGGRVAIVAPQD